MRGQSPEADAVNEARERNYLDDYLDALRAFVAARGVAVRLPDGSWLRP